jgi:hypothetical protein
MEQPRGDYAMRPIALIILAAIMVVASTATRPAEASGVPPAAATATASMATPPGPVEDHAGSRVAVQLVVAGIAAGLVVGVGTGAYLLRRKLGLTAYTPDQNAGGRH